MCLIIHAKPGIKIPAALVSDAAARNSDGVGAIVITGSKKKRTVKAERSVNRDCADTVKYVSSLPLNSERIVHLRMATHGSRRMLKHAHPFPLQTSGAYLVHNGVIGALGSAMSDAAENESDTEELARYLGKLDAPSLVAIWPLLSRTALNGQRVAVVFPNGRQLWAGRASGRQCEGLWLSNSYACSYGLPPVVIAPAPITASNGSRYGNDYSADYSSMLRVHDYGPGWLSRKEKRREMYAGRAAAINELSPTADADIRALLPGWSMAMD